MRAAGAATALLALAGCSQLSARDGCFEETTVQLPDERLVLKALNTGQAGRELVEAVFRGDHERVRSLLAGDPALVDTHVPPVSYPDFAPDRQFGDLLTFAVARCDAAMIDTLLASGVRADGAIPGSAVTLAVRGHRLDLLEKLLSAGASADPVAGSPYRPILAAGLKDDAEAARLLLRYGADPDWRDSTFTTALQTTVDGDSMQVAEAMIEAGADPWAVSLGGGLPARGIYEPLQLHSPQTEAARDRLIRRLRVEGAPWPPPDAVTVRQRILAGTWPPAGSNLPEAPLEVIERLKRDSEPSN